ncbi:MAG: Uma2 family endonuclease [Syntrophomonadaceae bacterium]|nr:Uma2 family endonuclease [Syntrophomonadaceae bacterium]
MSSPKTDRKCTYADYLNWPDEERWEIIDGVPYDMSPAPSTKHQTISMELGRQFANYLLDKDCQAIIAPFDVRIPAGDEKDEEIKTVVQPDIVVICDRSRLDKSGYRGAPGLIIEILSPATGKKDLQEKYRLYERSGVKEYWVVFPSEELLEVYQLIDDNNLRYVKTGTYQSNDRISVGILPELEIDLSLVFTNRTTL